MLARAMLFTLVIDVAAKAVYVRVIVVPNAIPAFVDVAEVAAITCRLSSRNHFN
jgi:hypothetical protein